MYSLWRDGVLLARIIEHGPVTSGPDVVIGFTGILDPAVECDFTGVRQARVTFQPGMPVIHMPLDPIDMSALFRVPPRVVEDRSAFSASARVGARRFTYEELRAPPELIFEIRRADTTIVPLGELTLQRQDFPDDPRARRYLRAFGVPDHIRTMWEVSAVFADARES